MPARSIVVESPAGLEELRDGWQRLAEANAAPYCQPAWQVAWWRHAAPRGSQLRAVAVYDGEELIGLAPFFCDPAARITEYRLLAAEICARVQPLAAKGREAEVAAALAAAMAGVSPSASALTLVRQPQGSPWPALLADAWPGKRPVVLTRPDDVAPALDLSGRTAEDFVPSLSKHLRAQVRRARRALEAEDASIAAVSADDAPGMIETLARLHLQRLGAQKSAAFLPGVDAMLAEAATEMIPTVGVRIWAVSLPQETICVLLFVAASGTVSFWLGAFEDRWRKLSPGIVLLVAAIEDSIERGEEVFDLGPGRQGYKVRVADGDQVLETSTLLSRGSGYALTRLRLAPAAARRAIGARLPERVKRLRRG